jgi:hypothetical protein
VGGVFCIRRASSFNGDTSSKYFFGVWVTLPCGTLGKICSKGCMIPTIKSFSPIDTEIFLMAKLKLKATDQHSTKGTEESLNNPSLQSISMTMQPLSTEVGKTEPKEDTGTMFLVTLIRVKYFLPIYEFHLKSDDAVDRAYKHIRERFNEEKFYYDQQNGCDGTIIVRARSKKDESVCGLAMIEKVNLCKNSFYRR